MCKWVSIVLTSSLLLFCLDADEEVISTSGDSAMKLQIQLHFDFRQSALKW